MLIDILRKISQVKIDFGSCGFRKGKSNLQARIQNPPVRLRTSRCEQLSDFCWTASSLGQKGIKLSFVRGGTEEPGGQVCPAQIQSHFFGGLQFEMDGMQAPPWT